MLMLSAGNMFSFDLEKLLYLFEIGLVLTLKNSVVSVGNRFWFFVFFCLNQNYTFFLIGLLLTLQNFSNFVLK